MDIDVIKDFLSIKGFKLLVIIAEHGIVYSYPEKYNLPLQVKSYLGKLHGLAADEVEAVFQNLNLFIKRTGEYIILVVSEAGTQGAIIRLQCDLIGPNVISSILRKK